MSVIWKYAFAASMLSASVASAQSAMLDPRVVDDGAKAALVSRTDPGQANDVLLRCTETARQVAAGVRRQGQVNLPFCVSFDIGIASVAGHDHRADAGVVARETSRRVEGYLLALGVPRDQVAATMDMLRSQVSARLRANSPG